MPLTSWPYTLVAQCAVPRIAATGVVVSGLPDIQKAAYGVYFYFPEKMFSVPSMCPRWISLLSTSSCRALHCRVPQSADPTEASSLSREAGEMPPRRSCTSCRLNARNSMSPVMSTAMVFGPLLVTFSTLPSWRRLRPQRQLYRCPSGGAVPKYELPHPERSCKELPPCPHPVPLPFFLITPRP
ncbi:hypothetical protein FRC0263_00823 [Corynebacterium diphtheriae]|nr:hypothetical protein FRC0263_00823 [Corynebacterium diphtheriae]